MVNPIVHGKGLIGEGLSAFAALVTLNFAEGLGRISAMLPVPGIVSDLMIAKATKVGVGSVHDDGKTPGVHFLVGGNPVKRLE